MAILSIQSFVSFGHVGNAGAVFCLQRTGHEVWPVATVAFSNHPGHGAYAGTRRPSGEVAEIVGGLERLGVLGQCRAVLSGYLGDAATGRVVLAAVERVRRANPDALYCCDPVMGDREPGLYVPADLARFFADEAASAADILVPNHFELEVLVGQPVPTIADVVGAARAILERGPRMLVVTSLATPELDAGEIGNAAITRAGAWLVSTPRLALRARGSGDALAALFLSRYLETGDPAAALEASVSSVFAVVASTVAADAAELRLVAAQDELVRPPRAFSSRPVA